MDINPELANELLTWLTGTKEFVLDQAPDLAQEIVMWGIWGNAASGTLCLITILGILGLGVFLWNKCDSGSEEQIAVIGIGALLSILPILIGVCEYMVMLKAIVAPKLYLLETLAGML